MKHKHEDEYGWIANHMAKPLTSAWVLGSDYNSYRTEEVKATQLPYGRIAWEFKVATKEPRGEPSYWKRTPEYIASLTPAQRQAEEWVEPPPPPVLKALPDPDAPPIDDAWDADTNDGA